ncbi:MAG TPA: nucleotide exchange factor GrpE [Candidatus Krumholzibacteria bacterium]|nr:nucleotide exchange factor GrpE [Candidatus Krumholzibacteria bacterium]HPD71096.1 nucleotide exchange factor GrpE [Candidatus Krumholzibacteria bacterium]HRY39204.1 nucleotide exchange factor GrpE [Candidatus Krumholzibacteria bacterium]
MNDEERPEIAEPDAAAGAGEALEPAASLEVEIVALRAELAEEHDRLLRALAELDNLRKRTRREIQDARRFAQAEALRPLLRILDDFDRALAQEPADGDPAFRQGVELISQNFRQILLDGGVRRIEAEGRAFDPAIHEAVGQQPAPEGTPPGTILVEVQAGYTVDDLVLRASRVIVAL